MEKEHLLWPVHRNHGAEYSRIRDSGCDTRKVLGVSVENRFIDPFYVGDTVCIEEKDLGSRESFAEENLTSYETTKRYENTKPTSAKAGTVPAFALLLLLVSAFVLSRSFGTFLAKEDIVNG